MPAAVMAIAGLLMSAREASNRKKINGEPMPDQKSLPSVCTRETGGDGPALHADDKDVAKDWG
jgi:hypothetical protein